jgi:hypothetical protein
MYYTSRPVLFFMCAGNEAFYAALYLLHFTEGPTGMSVTAWSSINAVQTSNRHESMKMYVMLI